MDLDKFVNDNVNKIEKIIFDSQGNIKEIKLKDDPFIAHYPYLEYGPVTIYGDNASWVLDGDFSY